MLFSYMIAVCTRHKNLFLLSPQVTFLSTEGNIQTIHQETDLLPIVSDAVLRFLQIPNQIQRILEEVPKSCKSMIRTIKTVFNSF